MLVDDGPGADDISGGDGNDLLFDGEFEGGATDRLSGGDGNDVLGPFNKPAKRDFVTCGSGFDRVAADTKDVVADDCERVAVGEAAIQEFFEELEEEGFFENFFGGLAPFPGE